MSVYTLLASHTWTYVKERVIRVGHLEFGEVYCSDDGSVYLRIGPSNIINHQVAYLKRLKAIGYSVPEVVEQGYFEPDRHYYIEKSIGDTTFGTLFSADFSKVSTISAAHFDGFATILLDFLQVQLRINSLVSHRWLEKYFYIDKLVRDYPIDRSTFERVIQKLQTRLQKVPLAYGHGDLTPFNVAEGGIFDIERAFVAPIGYDVLASLCTGRLWDFSDDRGCSNLAYDFTVEQERILLAKVDETSRLHSQLSISQYIDDFTILKMMWCIAHDNDYATYTGSSKRLDFHLHVIDYCMRCYIADQPIDRTRFSA